MALPPRTPDPDDTSQPSDFIPLGYAAQEIRALKDKIILQQTGSKPVTTTGTAAALVAASLDNAPAVNTIYTVIPHVANADNATFQSGAAAPVPIFQLDGTTPVIAGMLKVGVAASLQVTATGYILLNPQVDSQEIQSANLWDRTDFPMIADVLDNFTVAKDDVTSGVFLAANGYWDGDNWRAKATGYVVVLWLDPLGGHFSVQQSDAAYEAGAIANFPDEGDIGNGIVNLTRVRILGQLESAYETRIQTITGTITCTDSGGTNEYESDPGSFPPLIDDAIYRVEFLDSPRAYGNADNADPGRVELTLNTYPLVQPGGNLPVRYDQITRYQYYDLRYDQANGTFHVINACTKNTLSDHFRESGGVLDSYTSRHGLPITRVSTGIYQVDYSSFARVPYEAGIHADVMTHLTGDTDRRAYSTVRRVVSAVYLGLDNIVEFYVYNSGSTLVDLNDEVLRFTLPTTSLHTG